MEPHAPYCADGVFSLAVGYIILVVLIDGVLQDSFPAMIISLLMKFGMSQTEADRVYGTVFMQNKGLFVAVGFIILFLIFFYLAMSKVTRYLNSIGTEIETILSNSEAPVTLEPELRPISEKLNTLKMTLKRREYEAVESEQRKNDLVVFLAHDLKTPLTSIIAYLTMLTNSRGFPRRTRRNTSIFPWKNRSGWVSSSANFSRSRASIFRISCFRRKRWISP